MKRIALCLMLLTAIAVTFLLVSDTSAEGGPTFSSRDLRGEYFFNLVEIREEGVGDPPVPTTDYCDVAGTLNFDGIGTVDINSTRRCSATGKQTDDPLTLNYTVNSDGSFVITVSEPAPGSEEPADLVHGQIVNRGRSLLIDGTKRTDPDLMMFHGLAMKR